MIPVYGLYAAAFATALAVTLEGLASPRDGRGRERAQRPPEAPPTLPAEEGGR